MATFLYFAYGSNMLTERLCAALRCPSARPVLQAYAEDYTLAFSKKGADGSGKATLVPAEGCRRYGVLFEVDRAERDALDRAEGAGLGYDRVDHFPVIRADTNEPVEATTYIAIRPEPRLKPYDWYLAVVLAGARQHGLPNEQIELLRMQAYDRDTDETRKGRLEALAALKEAVLGNTDEILP